MNRAVQRPTGRQGEAALIDLLPLPWSDVNNHEGMRGGTVDIDAEIDGFERTVVAPDDQIIDLDQPNFPFRRTGRQIIDVAKSRIGMKMPVGVPEGHLIPIKLS